MPALPPDPTTSGLNYRELYLSGLSDVRLADVSLDVQRRLQDQPELAENLSSSQFAGVPEERQRYAGLDDGVVWVDDPSGADLELALSQVDRQGRRSHRFS